MSSIISTPEFGNEMAKRVTQPASTPTTPMGLGASTTGTVAQQTSWRTPRSSTNTPLSYSKRTRGTTFSWDDDTVSPKFEQR